MVLSLICGIAAALLQLISYIPYIRDILRGSTRPDLSSYAVWTILQAIAIAALMSAGATWSVLVLASLMLGNLAIIVLCLLGYGYKGARTIDIVCFAIAIIALVAWSFTNNPMVALVLSLIATVLAAVPTIAKELRNPRSEYAPSWFLMTLANMLALVAAGGSGINLIFPIYYILESATIGLLALRK